MLSMDRPNESTRAVKLPTQPTPTPNPYTDGEPFISIPEAAALSKIHVKTLYAKILKGDIPCFGRMNNYRVKLSDILPPKDLQQAKTGRKAEASRRMHRAKSLARHAGYVADTQGSSSTRELVSSCPF